MQQLSEFPRPGKKEHTVLHKTKQMTLRVRMLLDSMLPDKDITPSQGNIRISVSALWRGRDSDSDADS